MPPLATDIWESETASEDVLEAEVVDGRKKMKKSKRRSLKSKGVHFAEYADYYEILSLADYTSFELSNCWLSRLQKEKLDETLEKEVARMNKGKRAKLGTSFRGLEAYSSTRIKQMAIVERMCSVMDEQDDQIDAEITDADRIAQASLRISQASTKRALKRAKEDARSALNAYQSSPTLKYDKEKALPVYSKKTVKQPSPKCNQPKRRVSIDPDSTRNQRFQLVMLV